MKLGEIGQFICWVFNGKCEMECLFSVLTGKRKLCKRCVHNIWKEGGKNK